MGYKCPVEVAQNFVRKGKQHFYHLGTWTKQIGGTIESGALFQALRAKGKKGLFTILHTSVAYN